PAMVTVTVISWSAVRWSLRRSPGLSSLALIFSAVAGWARNRTSSCARNQHAANHGRAQDHVPAAVRRPKLRLHNGLHLVYSYIRLTLYTLDDIQCEEEGRSVNGGN